MLRRTERFMNMPVEIEWALDEAGFKMLQARPLRVRSQGAYQPPVVKGAALLVDRAVARDTLEFALPHSQAALEVVERG